MQIIMFNLTSYLEDKIPQEKLDRIFSHLSTLYPHGMDPWGLELEKIRETLERFYPLYKNYFKVRVFGVEKVQNQQYMVISNHSGQVAIDAVLIALTFLLEIDPPFILRSMVESFVPKMPFVGQFVAECGGVLGDRENCINLINHQQSILVFPEGVRGIAKSTNDYYHLQKFTRGFFRLALEARIDIVPIAVIGAEEFYPYVFHLKTLAKILGLPALPLSPTVLLGPVGLLPLPSPVDIYIGDPYLIPRDIPNDATDEIIGPHVDKLTKIIEGMITEGRKQRRPFWANKKEAE